MPNEIYWSLTALLNTLPFVAGAVFQSYFVTKDIKKTLYTLIGFAALPFITLAGILVKEIDVASTLDVSTAFLITMFIGFLIYAMLVSKEIIIPLSSVSSLMYTALFWVVFIPFIWAAPANSETFLFILGPSLFVTAVAIVLSLFTNVPNKDFWELLVYAWVGIYLFVFSVYTYKQVAAGVSGGLNLAHSDIDWVTIFILGSLFFEATIIAMSVLLMLPLFKDKYTPYREELKRAREFREEVNKAFESVPFTKKTASIFAGVLIFVLLLKFVLGVPNAYVVYLGLLSSNFLFD